MHFVLRIFKARECPVAGTGLPWTVIDGASLGICAWSLAGTCDTMATGLTQLCLFFCDLQRGLTDCSEGDPVSAGGHHELEEKPHGSPRPNVRFERFVRLPRSLDFLAHLEGGKEWSRRVGKRGVKSPAPSAFLGNHSTHRGRQKLHMALTPYPGATGHSPKGARPLR